MRLKNNNQTSKVKLLEDIVFICFPGLPRIENGNNKIKSIKYFGTIFLCCFFVNSGSSEIIL